MYRNVPTVGEGNDVLKGIAAELTEAAYPIVLRHGTRESWLDLELDLWKAVGGTVKKWGKEMPKDGSTDSVEAWRSALLTELTDEVLHLTLKQGGRGSPLIVELDLHEAFRQALAHLPY
jgi:hypothetical protein